MRSDDQPPDNLRRIFIRQLQILNRFLEIRMNFQACSNGARKGVLCLQSTRATRSNKFLRLTHISSRVRRHAETPPGRCFRLAIAQMSDLLAPIRILTKIDDATSAQAASSPAAIRLESPQAGTLTVTPDRNCQGDGIDPSTYRSGDHHERHHGRAATGHR